MRPIVGILFLAALSSAGCRTMKSVTLNELSTLRADRAWVTARDQSVVLMWEPKVVRDTLVGYIGRKHERLPSENLKQIRVRRSAPIRTTLLALGVVGGLGGLLFVAGGSGQSRLQGPASGGSADCYKHPDQPGCEGF